MKDKEWKHIAPQKAFSRAERKEQIIKQFGIWKDNQDTDPKTMNRIARALGMNPSQHVTDILLELCAEGKLTFEMRDKSGRWTARNFLLVDKTSYHGVIEKRQVDVKIRGVIAGQLELWS